MHMHSQILTCARSHTLAWSHTHHLQRVSHTYTHVYSHSHPHAYSQVKHTFIHLHTDNTHSQIHIHKHLANVIHKRATFIEPTKQHCELSGTNSIVQMRKLKLSKVKEPAQGHAVCKWKGMSDCKLCTAVSRIRRKPTHCVCDLLRISLIIPI